MLEIYIPVVNNPEFIELQWRCFKKFCQDEWKMIVFNDAKSWQDYSNFNDPTLKIRIKLICEKLGIEHHFVPNEHHKNILNASERHCSTINWVFRNFVSQSKNPILVFDSDMFPIKEFSMSRWDGNDFAGCIQKRENLSYLWPNLFFSQSNLPDRDKINWDILIDEKVRTDTGGKSHFYLQKYTKLNWKDFKYLSSLNWNRKNVEIELPESIWEFLENDIKNVDGKYWCELYDGIFLHYRAGSNWENISKEIHQTRIQSLKNCLEYL